VSNHATMRSKTMKIAAKEVTLEKTDPTHCADERQPASARQ